MSKIQRTDIHLVSRHSDMPDEILQKALEDNVYHHRADWHQFIRYFLLTLAVGFAVSGVVFFFAYNWDDLHKFVKIGIIEGLIICCMVVVFLPKTNPLTKSILLTAASVLVGVLFAVFGQIYQTGANAYDFFLGWTVFITLWVVVYNFAPLWTLFLLLVNTTIILYAEQVARDWSGVILFVILYSINGIALLLGLWFAKDKMPFWFTALLTIAAITFATIGMIVVIFGYDESGVGIHVLLTISGFGACIWYGFQSKKLFFLAVLAASMVAIISAGFLKLSEGEAMFFGVAIFIVLAITLVTKYLIHLQKQWNHEITE